MSVEEMEHGPENVKKTDMFLTLWPALLWLIAGPCLSLEKAKP